MKTKKTTSCPKASAAHKAYVDLFPSLFAASDFEASVLSIGDEFLPECVISVRRWEQDPDEEYWAWLTDQFHKAGGVCGGPLS